MTMTTNEGRTMNPKKTFTINTREPITLQKADRHNFERLVQTLAYCTFWMTSDLKNESGVWELQYSDTTEFVSDHPDDPENALLVVETRLEIKNLPAHWLKNEFLKLPADFQASIQTYLSRKPRPVKPSAKYADLRWLRWIMDPEQEAATNQQRKAAGLPPITEDQKRELIGRIQLELHRPTRLTRHSRANRAWMDDEGDETAIDAAQWFKTPFFVEPPDLLDYKYADQYLAWRQLLYRVMWACTLEIHTSQRPKPAKEEGGENSPSQAN